MCSIISTQKLQITSTPPEDHRCRESHSKTSTHYTLHIYTPVCFALFCFVLLCFPFKVCGSSVRDLSHPAKNMSHKTEHVGHWEDLETWLSFVTVSLLPKAAETLQHQTQDQLDDNITSLMRQDPSQSYSHKRISQDHRLLKSHTHRHPQTERQARCTTPAGADKRTTTHRAAGT